MATFEVETSVIFKPGDGGVDVCRKIGGQWRHGHFILLCVVVVVVQDRVAAAEEVGVFGTMPPNCGVYTSAACDGDGGRRRLFCWKCDNPYKKNSDKLEKIHCDENQEDMEAHRMWLNFYLVFMAGLMLVNTKCVKGLLCTTKYQLLSSVTVHGWVCSLHVITDGSCSRFLWICSCHWNV